MAKTTIELRDHRLRTISSELRPKASRHVRQTGLRILRRAQRSMAEPKHGRVRVRGRKTHQASAPGEAPAVDMGFLRGSMGMEMEGDLVAAVYAAAAYAARLEFGGGRIAARPFMRPAMEEEAEEFYRGIGELFK